MNELSLCHGDRERPKLLQAPVRGQHREIIKVLNRSFRPLVLHKMTTHRIEQFKRERLAGKWRGYKTAVLEALPRVNPWVFANSRTGNPSRPFGAASQVRSSEPVLSAGDVTLHTLRHTVPSRMIAGRSTTTPSQDLRKILDTDAGPLHAHEGASQHPGVEPSDVGHDPGTFVVDRTGK